MQEMYYNESSQQPQRSKVDGVPRFYKRTMEDKQQSIKAGRPKYHDIDYVEISIPGDTRTLINKKVTEEDKENWPQQWHQFQKNQEQVIDGTPLKMWGGISLPRAMELQHFKITTVEQLADMNESFLKDLGSDVYELINRAKGYLASGDRQDVINENASLKDKLKDIEAQIEKVRNDSDIIFKDNEALKIKLVQQTAVVESSTQEKLSFERQKSEINKLVSELEMKVETQKVEIEELEKYIQEIESKNSIDTQEPITNKKNSILKRFGK